ncbi:hypothetical protein MRX96_049544 [Rhipicephalus microplus]
MRNADSSGISLSFDDWASSNLMLCPGNFIRKSIESDTSRRRSHLRGAASFGRGSRWQTSLTANWPHPSGLVCAAAVVPASPPRAKAAAAPYARFMKELRMEEPASRDGPTPMYRRLTVKRLWCARLGPGKAAGTRAIRAWRLPSKKVTGGSST